jgi:hypothetical protein
MRVLTLATLLFVLPATFTAAETRSRESRADAPRLLKESLRTGTADPEAMGAIVRWVLQEKEEKVAGAFAEALAGVDPRLQGVQAERWNGAARSVLAVFQGVLRDAERHRRRDGDAILRELRPAIDAAADALKQVRPTIPDAPVPEQ